MKIYTISEEQEGGFCLDGVIQAFINEDTRDKVWESCKAKGDHIGCETEEYDVVAPKIWVVVDDYDGSVHLFFSKESAERGKDFLEKLHGVPGVEGEFVRVLEAEVEE